MKKFVKVILIIICVLIVIGGGLLGGLYIANNYDSTAKSFDRTGTFTVKFENAGIDSVKADLSCASIKFVKGSEWSVRFENVFTDYSSADTVNNMLVIKSTTEKDLNIWGWKLGTLFQPGLQNMPIVYVTYPENTEFEDINIQLGFGNCTLKDITAEDMVCQVCAGRIELENCYLNKKSAFQLLLGSFKADNVRFRDGSVKITAGLSRIKLDSTSRAADVTVKTTLGYKDIE